VPPQYVGWQGVPAPLETREPPPGCHFQPLWCHNPPVNEPVHASLILPGSSPEEVFAALVDVERFPEWALGLKKARALDAPGGAPDRIVPGTKLEFTLSAGGLTHRVVSTITAVETPQLLEWRYTEGATGTGGWTLANLEGAVKMTLRTSYKVKPAWLDRLVKRPFFRGMVEDLLRQSLRRFRKRLAES
jgi:uncharacterized membrane protein